MNLGHAQYIYDEFLVKDGGWPSSVKVVEVRFLRPLVAELVLDNGRTVELNGKFVVGLFELIS